MRESRMTIERCVRASANARDERGRWRKAMNSFICSPARRFEFVGAINEDVNTYVLQGSRGDLFFTYTGLQLNQMQTQAQAGGMTDIYLDLGTYIKSFTTVLFHPSSVRAAMLSTKFARMHHVIDWGDVRAADSQPTGGGGDRMSQHQLSIDFGDGQKSRARPAHQLPGARKRDPATSHAAAASATSLSCEHHAAILVALERGPLGKDGIASSARLTGVQVCRRLPELMAMGMVEPTGRTVRSDSGRAEREFRLKRAV